MKNSSLPIILCILLILAIWAHFTLDKITQPQPLPQNPQRIISLAPSLTESLYALDLGDQVAGVTQFCNYPPEALNKPEVAGFSDINLEALLRARPDLVVMPLDKTWNKIQLERLGLPVLALETRSMAGLIQGIEILSQVGNRSAQGKMLLESIQHHIEAATARSVNKARPSVLFVVMHSYQGVGYISEISAVGSDGFYSELIEIAGGKNVYTGNLPYPRLSREAIIFLNPDVIVDVISPEDDLAGVKKDWETLASVNAIKNKRLLLLTDELHTVPGPRFVKTLSELSLAFHPENRTGGLHE